jgi:hypothetical protein
MKTKLLPKIILGLAAIAAITAAPRASAVPVGFSGGGGTPLSFTLSQPVTYTITASTGLIAPYFVFQNVFPSSFFSQNVSGSISFSINGGPALTIQVLGIAVGGSITANDLILQRTLPLGFTVGDVIVLSGGTVTTLGNVTPAAPASGNFNTFMASTSGARISTDGTTGSSVPETLATLWLALPLAAMFAARRFRIDAPGH